MNSDIDKSSSYLDQLCAKGPWDLFNKSSLGERVHEIKTLNHSENWADDLKCLLNEVSRGDLSIVIEALKLRSFIRNFANRHPEISEVTNKMSLDFLDFPRILGFDSSLEAGDDDCGLYLTPRGVAFGKRVEHEGDFEGLGGDVSNERISLKQSIDWVRAGKTTIDFEKETLNAANRIVSYL